MSLHVTPLGLTDLTQLADSRKTTVASITVPSVELRLGADRFKRAFMVMRETASMKLNMGLLPLLQIGKPSPNL